MAVVTNATCTFCACTCDDIEIQTEGDRIVKAKNSCILGGSWFLNHTAEPHYPEALINGQPATLAAAVEAAADYLVNANYPLIYGLSNTTCETQRLAVTLTEQLGGVIDSHSSI
jgi:formylmethanofuran dehydrogenase subunit B